MCSDRTGSDKKLCGGSCSLSWFYQSAAPVKDPHEPKQPGNNAERISVPQDEAPQRQICWMSPLRRILFDNVTGDLYSVFSVILVKYLDALISSRILRARSGPELERE